MHINEIELGAKRKLVANADGTYAMLKQSRDGEWIVVLRFNNEGEVLFQRAERVE